MLHIFLSNRAGEVKYGTTGKPVPGYDCKLVGEDGAPVKKGEMGELLIKGPTSAIMYWNNREQSCSTFLGPWTRSGDKYLEDEQGYFVYCGRHDDMLKVSGLYVSPFEVEGALATHPDVLEAAVVAWPDADTLIKPKAFVVLKDQTKVADAAARDAMSRALQEHVKTRLAPYKYPRWIEFRPTCRRPRPARFSASNCAARARRASVSTSISLGGVPVMKRLLLAGCAVAALAAIVAAPSVAQQKTIKIGFVSTFSGPVAAIGNDMRNSFELALDHHGRKLGGLPVEVIYEDDQIKPEVGVQKTQKLIESDKVDFLVGYIWSNVMLASLKPIVDSKTFTIVTNAGASQLSGELCSPYVFSTSWNNDQTPQAIGLYMNQKNVKKAFLIGPNYAAGKDMLEGVAATFKGEIIGRELTALAGPARLLGRVVQGARGAGPTRSSRSIRAAPASSSSRSTRSPASRARFRSTPRSPSTRCRCRG